MNMEQLTEAFREFEEEETKAKAHVAHLRDAIQNAKPPRVGCAPNGGTMMVSLKTAVGRTLFLATIDAEIKATEERIGAMRAELHKAVIAAAKGISK